MPRAQSPAGVVAQTEMMAERFQILETLRRLCMACLEYLADAAVQLGAPAQEQVAVDHVARDDVRKTVGARPAGQLLVAHQEFGVAQRFEHALVAAGRGDLAQQTGIEGAAQNRGLLQAAPLARGQPVDA